MQATGAANVNSLLQLLADLYEQHKAQLPVMIWRDNSPQHFPIPRGAASSRRAMPPLHARLPAICWYPCLGLPHQALPVVPQSG